MDQPQARGFRLVDEEQAPSQAAPSQTQGGIDQLIQPKPPLLNRVAIDMMQIALSTIWQQFAIAIASLFQLATVASVFVLWYITPDPNQNQIVMLTIYATFILIINYLRRGR